MALGYFVIHVMGHRYGIKSSDATMLAVSFDEVERRLSERGSHKAPFAQADAMDIANAYTYAVYLDHETDTFLGLSEPRFRQILDSNRVVWAPDGDEAFDDSSYVMQFDVDEQVRLVAFKRPDGLVDPASLTEVWLFTDVFYEILGQWRDQFLAEWESLPKEI